MLKTLLRFAYATTLTSAAIATPLAAASACTPAHSFTTVTPGTLTVAAVNYQPYSLINTDGTLSGTDGDIIAKIAEKECLKLAVIPSDYAGAIQYLIAGRADLTLGDWYRTAARAKVVDLTDPIYSDQVGFASKEGYDTLDQVMGKPVGSVQGYLFDTDMKAVLGDSFKTYPDSVHAEEDYAAGRLDVDVDGYTSLLVAQKGGALKGAKITVLQPDKRVLATMAPAQSTFPSNKADTGMVTALNEDIAAMHASGELAAILAKYGLPAAMLNTGAPRLQ